jgi:hypothetical protein
VSAAVVSPGAMPGLAERLVNTIARRSERSAARSGTTRRGFLGGAALVGAALAVDPWGYLTRPASAIDAICGAGNTCAAGYTVFCCTINGGHNTCPPDTFVGGWWKADHSSFCGGSARYYIDCNAFRDRHYTCHCNQRTCDRRRVACNQFRYGQCNTQIPWSSTGPVVCRVVSCTAPWVQYGHTCSSSSATDNSTATHSAPCVGARPYGTIDSVTTSGNTVRVNGWAYDRDQPSASIRVVLCKDGHALTVWRANKPRPDVNRAVHITGNHGFSIPLTATNGVHRFKVYALNVGGGSGNTLIGTKSVNVNPGSPPRGYLDLPTAEGNIVHLRGWAYDRDAPGSPVRLVVYQDGKALTVISTTVLRPDVNRAFGITGTHGFSVPVPTSDGRHNYRVYAMNIGGGVGNPLIGVHNIVVNSDAKPAGQLNRVTASGNTVHLAGWAYDPDQPAREIPVVVYEDDEIVHWYPTGVARPDVNSARGVTGDHGFDITLSAGPGVHTFTVHAIGLAGGTENPVIGSRTVAIDQNAPLGHVDNVTVIGGTVRLTGWAYDPDQPGAEIAVTVYRDGAPLSRHATGIARPEINRNYGAGGNHGFDITVDAAPGRHSFTVYAANVSAARPDSMIGGQSVSVEPTPARTPHPAATSS